MSKETAEVEATGKEKKIQVATTVDKVTFDKLNDIRWEERHERIANVVRAAITEFLAARANVAPSEGTGAKR